VILRHCSGRRLRASAVNEVEKTKPIFYFTAENAGAAEQGTIKDKYYFPAVFALSAVNLKKQSQSAAGADWRNILYRKAL